jgi:hypothetical protein
MRSDLGSTEPIWTDVTPVGDPIFDSGYYVIGFDVKGLKSGSTETITPILYGVTGTPISSNGRSVQSIYVTGTTSMMSQQIQFVPSAGFTAGISNVSLIPSMTTDNKLDLYEEDSYVLNFQITTDISTRGSNYSKTIKVPGTPTNNKIFSMLMEENMFIGTDTGSTTLFFNKRIPAGIYQDTIQLMIGYFELESVVKSDNHVVEYEGTFYGNSKSLADTIGDKLLTGNDNPLDDLDYSQYDHKYTIPNVLNSYPNVGIVYLTTTSGSATVTTNAPSNTVYYKVGDTLSGSTIPGRTITWIDPTGNTFTMSGTASGSGSYVKTWVTKLGNNTM